MTVSRYALIKICIWTKIKSSCGRLVDTTENKSQLVKLITNCRVPKITMICRVDMSKMRYTHNFNIPSYIGIITDHVSLTTTNDLNRLKVGHLSSKMPRLNIYLKHKSIEMKHLFHSYIYPLNCTKLSILKMISSIFI